MINKQITRKLYYLGFALILLDMSLMYINRGGQLCLNRFMLPQFFVSVIFGFIHGNKKFSFIKKLQGNYSVLDILYPTILYIAWYNVILLPVSGLGILEWIFTAFLLFSDFICLLSENSCKEDGEKVTDDKNSVDKKFLYLCDDDNLLYTGAFLALFKQIIFYFFPENIYSEYFVGNDFARLLILFFSVLGLIFLVSSLIKIAKIQLKTSEENSENAKKVENIKNNLQTILGKIKNKLVLYFQSFLSIISGPALIIVILCILIIVLMIIMIWAKNLAENILLFVETFLLKLLSTGKITIVPSVLYYIFQIIVVFGVMVFDKVVFNTMREKKKNKGKR